MEMVTLAATLNRTAHMRMPPKPQRLRPAGMSVAVIAYAQSRNGACAVPASHHFAYIIREHVSH